MLFTPGSPGLHEYRYQLKNGSATDRQLGALILEVPNPERTQTAAEAGWLASGAKSIGTVPASILVARSGPDAVERIKPGRSVTFTVLTSDAPGLVRARILPTELPIQPNELTDGQFFDGASPWVRQKLLELDSVDRREVLLYSVGPKVALPDDRLDRVTNEVREAAGLPVFAEVGPQLLAASRLNSGAAVAAALAGLGRTPLQVTFSNALAWRARQLR